MDENQAVEILQAATPETAPENPAPPAATGVVAHIRALIQETADDLGAEFGHVRDMIFRHL